jgi:hypothetical protein
MSIDVSFECLRINIDSAAGQEHRLHQIATRAAAIFGERLSERLIRWDRPESAAIGVIDAGPVDMNLHTCGDEEAAGSIANAWLDAFASKTASQKGQERNTDAWPH